MDSRELPISEDRFRTLFHTIRDGFCIVRMIYDDAGHAIDYLIVDGNPAYGEHTGLKDSIGKTVREAEPNIEPFWIETYGRIAKTGVPEQFENYVQAWDRWFEVYAYRLGDPANHEVAIFFKEITARKLAERALADANQRIEAGLMAGEVATYSWDIRNDRLRGDKNFARLFGVLKNEHASAPIGDFMKVIHPDDWAHVEEALDATLERDEPYEVEYRIVGAGSSDQWVLVRGEVVDRDADGAPLFWSGVLVDITERKRIEQSLRDSEANFRALADNIPQLAWMTDATGWIFWYNRRWHDYTGTSLEEVRGWDWQKVHHPEHLQRVVEKFRRHIRTGETWEDTFPLRSASGEYRWFLSRAFAIHDANGEVVRWFGTNTDITEQRLAEEALREADRRKDVFLATLGHELRNPLAPITNAIQVIRQLGGSNNPQFDELFGIVERQSAQLMRLVDDLLDVSRISRGRLALKRARVLLQDVLDSAIEGAQPLIQVQEHKLSVSMPQEPCYVDGDASRLSQVFLNVLNNAAKYTSPGGHISMTVECAADHATMTIRDDGPGIGAELLPKIFELFVQGHEAGARVHGGLGIGLPLARELVEMHGGSIEARSDEPGPGSEFVIRLPLATPPAPSGKTTDLSRPTIHARRWRIVVVDDNVDAADTLALSLELLGHTVITRYDAAGALAAIEAERPDLAILDIGLPDFDGYELARRIRHAHGEALTLVALTGWGQAGDRQRAREAGFDLHRTKPIDSRDLMAAVAALG